MLEYYVRGLINDHFAVFPPPAHGVPTALISEGIESGVRLIRTMRAWSFESRFTRIGEKKADIGLIEVKPEEQKDIKFFFHLCHDIFDFMNSSPEHQVRIPSIQRELYTLLQLYTELCNFTRRIVRQVESDLQLPGLIRKYERSRRESLAHSTTVLRVLWYPDGPAQRGARRHFDIDFITTHLGDRGGSLLAHTAVEGGKAFPVSPDDGSILVFWGLKALVVSGGRLVPLQHSAVTEAGADRVALTQFHHLETDPQILPGYGQNLDYCLQKAVGSADGRGWYRQRMGQVFLAARS